VSNRRNPDDDVVTMRVDDRLHRTAGWGGEARTAADMRGNFRCKRARLSNGRVSHEGLWYRNAADQIRHGDRARRLHLVLRMLLHRGLKRGLHGLGELR